MLDIPIIDHDQVQQIEWTGDSFEYDKRLSKLGQRYNKFVVVNPSMKEYLNLINSSIESNQCIVWKFQGQWIAKQFCKSWDPEIGYQEIEIKKPNFTWRKNPDLDRTMTFEDDPFGEFEPDPWDWNYELVWYIDPRFNPLEDKVWALSCTPIGSKTLGIKDMGYLVPSVEVDINPDLTDIEVDIDELCPAFWDLSHECAYQLDPKHTDGKEMWVVKFRPTYRKPKDWRWYGQISPNFEIEYNPNLPKMDYELDYDIPYYDIGYDHVWMLNRCHLQNNEADIWAFKIITSQSSKGTKVIGQISPQIKFEVNPDITDLDYEINYITPWYDFQYEHVWYLDKEHLTDDTDPIWAVRGRYVKKPTGSKVINDIKPLVKKIINPLFESLEFEIDYDIPYFDLEYEHVWMLDTAHTQNITDEIWAVKLVMTSNSRGTKNMGYITPKHTIEINPELKDFPVPNNLVQTIQYHDFAFTNTWMLDKEISSGFDIWAIKINFQKKQGGWKQQGFITPSYLIEYNPELKNVNLKIDYKIPYHDRDYLHEWWLDPDYANGDRIWYAKLRAVYSPSGTKDMGYIRPPMPKYLDVFFLSYNESNADANFEKLKSVAPWAQRIDGVKGIFAAHKKAAELSQTDMFYVVDGDADILEGWKFNFQPNIFDRDCAYVWSSKNPINDLTYGYGGVKLFNKSILMKQKSWKTLDMFTGIMPKLKVQSRVSNITAFNTDPFSTWRSAFRECVKLSFNLIKNSNDAESKQRLSIWLTTGIDRPFGKFAIDGANDAVKFVDNLKDNVKELSKINDYVWLEKQFKDKYE